MRQDSCLSASKWTVFQDKCTIPAPFKPTIMCYSPICRKFPGKKGTVFFSNISYATYICTYCCYCKSLDHPLKPQTQGSTMTIIYPDKATSTVYLQKSLHIVRLSHACSATSNYFHLPPRNEDYSMVMNVSKDTANINAINISTLNFRIWQHFSRKLDSSSPA